MHGQTRMPSCLHLAHAAMYNSDAKPTGYCKWKEYSNFLFEGKKLKPEPTWAGGWLVSDFTEPNLCLLAADGQGSGCPIFEKFWWRFRVSEELDKLCAAFKQIDMVWEKKGGGLLYLFCYGWNWKYGLYSLGKFQGMIFARSFKVRFIRSGRNYVKTCSIAGFTTVWRKN